MYLDLSEVQKNISNNDELFDYIRVLIIHAEKGIVIFGCSTIGKQVYTVLKHMDIIPICFCDDKVDFELYEEIPVVGVEIARERYKECFFVIAVDSDYDNICEQMIQMGIRNVIDKNVFMLLYQNEHRRTSIKLLRKKRDDEKLIINQICCIITNVCTLNCKCCNEFIPYIRKYGHCDLKRILRSVDVFLKSIDYVSFFEILGGEPFLHPDLEEIIRAVSDYDNVFGIVLVTNGTIVPEDDILKVISKLGIAIRITDYGELSRKKNQLIEACDRHGILYTMQKPFTWYDYGPLTNKYADNISPDKYRDCFRDLQIYNGQFHLCSRSSKGVMTGIISKDNGEFVDLVGNGDSYHNIRKQIRRVLNMGYPKDACRYCEGNIRVVPAGLQERR